MPDIDPRALQDALNNLNNVSAVVTATMEALAEKERLVLEILERISSRFEDVGTDAKALVSHVSATKQELSDLLRLVNLTNAKGIFDRRTLKEVHDHLEGIARLADKISRTPGYSAVEQSRAKKVYGEIRKLLEEVDEKARKAYSSLNKPLDADMVKKFTKTFEDLGFTLSSVHAKVEKMRGPVEALGKSFRELFGDLSPRMLDPFMRAFDRMQSRKERGALVKREAEENIARGVGAFKEKAAKSKTRLGRFFRDIPFDETGKVDEAELAKMDAATRRNLRQRAGTISRMKPAEMEEMLGEFTERQGIGGVVEKFLMGRAVRRAAGRMAAGEAVGDEAVGIGMMARGGGSMVAGGAEAGAAGLGELAGEAAPVIAILALLREGFDGMIESNKDLYARLGTGGGLFTGPQAPASALQNVRMNLTPLLNLYGQTYDSNLKMAEAITKFGVSVGDLSDLGNDLNNNIIGKAGGPVGGGIATTVFGGARLAGLDQVAATEQVMKLLQQYHQSLEGTDAFFNKLNMDTKAAGITSVKYIQILDEISGQFDHMARGIDDVTSALRMLGHTGILTSEQVTDALKAMTTKTTPEVGAFLAMQPAFAQKTARALRAAQTADVGTQAENAYNALVDAFQSTGMTKEDAAKRLKAQGITVDTLSDLRTNAAAKATMVAGQVLTGVGDATRKQAVGSALENLQAGRQALQATTNYLANPTRGALELAFQPNMGPAAAVAMNITKLQQVLMRAGGLGQTPEAAMRTFILHPEQMAGRAMEINQLANALQLNPEDIPKLRTAVMAGAGAEIQDALKGALPTEEYQKIAGYLGMGAGATKEDVIGRLGSSTDDQTKAMEGLSSDWDTFTQLWERGGPLSKTLEDSAKAQGLELKTQAARDLGMALTTTNDYLKEITDFLTHQIYELMTDILEAIPGHKVNPAEQARKVAELERSRGLSSDTSLALRSMTGELGGWGVGPRATVQTDLEKAKNIQANLQAEVDRMRGDVADAQAAAEKDPTKKAAADKAASDLADKQQMLMQVGTSIDSSQKALQQLQDYKAGKVTLTDPQGKGVLSVFEHMRGILALGTEGAPAWWKEYYHPERALPRGAQAGAAATSPAVEGVRPSAEKGTSIKTTNVSNSVTMGLAQAAPAKPVAPERSTEAVNPDTAGVAKAVVDQHKAASTRTMVQ
jgi:hypothetical protein